MTDEMPEKDLYDRGIAVRRAVLGDAHVDRSLARATPFDGDFQEYITKQAWGSVWTRPGLDIRTRSMLTIAMLAALGQDGELALHIRATRNTGVTRDEVKEILLQAAVYAGVPAANHAIAIARAVYDAMDAEDAEAQTPGAEPIMTDPLLDPLFTTAEAALTFAPAARLQGMLDFEAALARAEASVGVIPATAVAAIAAACDAALYDLDALGAEAALAGNIAIPMVKHLTRRVTDADADAARFVHWGATSQDAMDSGLMLQLRRFIDALDADLARLSAGLATLADRHRDTPMVARTWLQHALPTLFGLKAAGWLDALGRDRQRLAAARGRLALQFGGAAGTLAALGDAGPAVAEALAAELNLPLPALPWHASRDRIAELAAALGILAGTLGTIGRDVSLLMQTEVAEAFEPAGPGRGGSSTMPHKRNPVSCAVLLSAAIRAPALVGGLFAAQVQEHERGLGGWHAEWQALPDLARLVAGAARHATTMIAGLTVDAARMLANLDLTHGLILAEAVTMALGERMGRLAAHSRVAEASRRAAADRRPLRDVLAEDAEIVSALGADGLDRLFDPARYTGSAACFIDRVLTEHAARGDAEGTSTTP